MHSKEWGFATIFGASLVLTGAVFQTSWERVLALAPTSVVSSCQAVTNYVFNWYFPLRLSLSVLLACLAGVTVMSMLRAWLQARQIRRDSLPHSAKLAQALRVLQIPSARVVETAHPEMLALTVGLFQPSIVVSRQLIRNTTPKQLKAILIHEFHHLERHHPFFFVLGQVVSQALWFIPSLGEFAHYMKVQLEIEADQAVVNHQRTTVYLRRALAKMISTSSTTSQPALAVYPAFAHQPIQYRVAQLTHSDQSNPSLFSSWKALVSLAVVLTMSGFVLAKPAPTLGVSTQPGQHNNCSLFECVSACVQEELMSEAPAFSPARVFSSAVKTE